MCTLKKTFVAMSYSNLDVWVSAYAPRIGANSPGPSDRRGDA